MIEAKDLLKQTEQFVIDTFTKADTVGEILHHRRTVHWIKELKSDADEALLIAGMSHDIERAFNGADSIWKNLFSRAKAIARKWYEEALKVLDERAKLSKNRYSNILENVGILC